MLAVAGPREAVSHICAVTRDATVRRARMCVRGRCWPYPRVEPLHRSGSHRIAAGGAVHARSIPRNHVDACALCMRVGETAVDDGRSERAWVGLYTQAPVLLFRMFSLYCNKLNIL